MKKVRLSYLRGAVLAALFAFVLFASISSKIGEFYAIFIYPALSGFLSAVSSVVGFSFDEWGIILAVLLLVVCPFYWRMQKRRDWLAIVRGEVEILLWVYVWFYWGWGMNYYRASFFQRAEVKPAAYDEVQFDRFLAFYKDGMDRAFQDCQEEGWMNSPDLFVPMDEVDDRMGVRRVGVKAGGMVGDSVGFTRSFVHACIKDMYRKIPEKYGLCKPKGYQEPKRSSFNGLYSNVGVLGFMGPFFAESHVNLELSVLEYPFTYAHELSHLLGVSSEAEANLWAFSVCAQSDHPLIRLSGYMGLLSYVRANASYLLPPVKFDEWESSLEPEIKAAFYRVHAYWTLRYNSTLGEIQSVMYNFYLKRNKISSGQKNYAQVIVLLLALPDFLIPTR